jgi:hypothetical protein
LLSQIASLHITHSRDELPKSLNTMGIPYLLQFLSPYATVFYYNWSISEDSHDVLDNPKDTPKPTAAETAIIDGPALAYHAYHEALRQRREATNAIDATPQYSEINATAVRYLENLEKHGFLVAAIFFDGFLPPKKKKTRLERATVNINDLKAFKKAHSSHVETSHAGLQEVPTEQTP